MPAPTSSPAVDPIESAKKLAATRAVEEHLDPSFKYVGIGSGSTIVYVVEAIASKGPSFYSGMTFIPTGSQSRGLIRKAGLTLCRLDERPEKDGTPVALDVAFDGADEVDGDLNLIKGGGACLFQEKLVATAAKKFVAVAGTFFYRFKRANRSPFSLFFHLLLISFRRFSQAISTPPDQVEDYSHRSSSYGRSRRYRPSSSHWLHQCHYSLWSARQGW